MAWHRKRAAAAALLTLGVMGGHAWLLAPALLRSMAPTALPEHRGRGPIALRVVSPPPAASPPPVGLAPVAALPQPQPVLHAAQQDSDAALPPAAPVAAAALPPTAVADDAGLATLQQPLPAYATADIPPVTLNYEVRRGELHGTGRLQWTASVDDYTLSLQADVPGRPGIDWLSRGGFDAAGLAPVRMVERRRGRETSAVNFQRNRGVVSYSASGAVHALADGMQDRLSWIVQLAAVLGARPRALRTGEELSFWVVGTRSSPEPWTFRVMSAEPLHLRREPSRPYDTRVDVWPHAAAHHLPVLLQMVTVPGGELTAWHWTGATGEESR
jgi:hypothetical protein